MSEENRSDNSECRDPFRFPKKIFNRTGLNRIAYRIGEYSDLRESLFRNLNEDEVLSSWTYRESDDPGIALLEGACVIGDILTFYQELYANEAYLRTARWRESILDLVRLLGYLPAPGTGGRGRFAFEVKGSETITVPAGFPLKARLQGPANPSTDLRTEEDLEAHPELSQFFLYRPFYYPGIEKGTDSFSVQSSLLVDLKPPLKKGDRLLLYPEGDPEHSHQIVTVREVEELLDRTRIRIEGSWQHEISDELMACRLGETFRYFGHNAPLTKVVVSSTGLATVEPVGFTETLYKFEEEKTTFPLDRAVANLNTGSFMAMSVRGLHMKVGSWNGSTLTVSRIVGSYKDSAQRDPLSESTTYVEFEEAPLRSERLPEGAVHPDPTLSTLELTADIRGIEFHEIEGQPFLLKSCRTPDESVGALTQLYVYGSGSLYGKLEGRPLMLTGEGGRSEEVVVHLEEPHRVEEIEETLRPVNLTSPPDLFTVEEFSLEEPFVRVFGNLVWADQGKQENEVVLGNGDSRKRFQSFPLPKKPLTYRNDPSVTPPIRPELEVYVNKRLWKRVPSLYGHGPGEEIYIVREDFAGISHIQFGDGKSGARLPSGKKNVVARFRTGSGAFGPLLKGASPSAGGRLPVTPKIHLHGTVSGGSDPESGGKAARTAPGTVQSLNRLVSLQDYETEANALGGVTRASAKWAMVDRLPSVLLTVLMETGRWGEMDSVRSLLSRSDRERGAFRHPVVVSSGKIRLLRMGATVELVRGYREEDVRERILYTLGAEEPPEERRAEFEGEGEGITHYGLFRIDTRDFGEAEYLTRIEGVIQNVEGVGRVRLNHLSPYGERGEEGFVEAPATVPAKPLLKTVPCPGDTILTLETGDLELIFTPMSEGGEIL